MKRDLQASTTESEQPQSTLHVSDPVPDVCFIPDVCKALGISRRTVARLLRHGAFPLPELPALDRRHRWSGARVRQFRESAQQRSHGRSLRAVSPNRIGNSVARKGVI